MSNPDKYDQIPDERTEEEELMEQIAQLKGRAKALEEESDALYGDVLHLQIRLMNVRKENAAFLKAYAPDGIGSDPEDGIDPNDEMDMLEYCNELIKREK